MINHGCLSKIINIGHSSEHIKCDDIIVQITLAQHPDLEVHFHDGEHLYVSTVLRDSFTHIPPLHSIIKINEFAILLKTIVVFDFKIISQSETETIKTNRPLDYHPIYEGNLPILPKKRHHLLLQPLELYPPPPVPIKPIYIKKSNSIKYPMTELIYNNQSKTSELNSKLPITNQEILFWKVIHNKYLFRIIINKIQTTDWLKFEDCRKFNIDNRIKFKNINSLEWIIKNEMFSLLKLKLMKDEYIEIKETGLILFMKSITKYSNGEVDSSNMDESKFILVSTLFKLLLEKKNVELKGYDLFKLALHNKHLKVIEILASNPNKLISDTISYPSHFPYLKKSNKVIKSLKYVIEIPNVSIYSCKPFGSLFSEQKDNHLSGGYNDVEIIDCYKIKSIYLNSISQEEYSGKIEEYCKQIGYKGRDIYETASVIPKEWDEFIVYALNTGSWILEGSNNWRTTNREVKWVGEILETNVHNSSELLFEQCKLRYYSYYITPRTQFEIFERLYFIPFIKSLSSCNLKNLKIIGDEISNDPDIGTINRNYSYSFHEFNKECSISNIIETVNYFNSTGYGNLNNLSFYNFFKSLMNHQINLKDIIDIGVLNSLDKQLLLELFSLFSPPILEIIFENNNRHTLLVGFTIPLPLIEKIKSKRAPIKDVILCIEMLVNQFNIYANKDNVVDNGQNLLIVLEELINFYYFELIQNQLISVGKLKSIHQLIVKNEKPIQLNHNVNHFILYMNIKSNKLEKFINQDLYRKNIIGDVPLQFEVIFGGYEFYGDNGISFDDLIQLLIHDLCHLPLITTITSDRYRSLYFNYTLIYLLQIKKVDLFFKEMEYIKQFCNRESGNNYSISKQYEPTDALFESIFKTLDEESLLKFALSYMKRFKKPKDHSLYYMEIILKCYTLNSRRITKYFNLESIIPSLLSSFTQPVAILIKKYRSLFFPNNGGSGIIHLGKLFNSNSYQIYDIELYSLFLKYAPNHRLFSFSTEKIDRALEYGKLSFLLHFYQNGKINDDNCLVKYLQFKLRMHLDYQCIDWSNMI